MNTTPQTAGLNLLAQSIDDLKLLSASIQDAIVKVGEIFYDRDQRSLTIRLSRFRHEDRDGKKSEEAERVLSGLQIQDILSLASKNIDRSNPKAFMVLLSLDFTPADDGTGGVLQIMFAGDGMLRLELDCLDLSLMDVSKARATTIIPSHS